MSDRIKGFSRVSDIARGFWILQKIPIVLLAHYCCRILCLKACFRMTRRILIAYMTQTGPDSLGRKVEHGLDHLVGTPGQHTINLIRLTQVENHRGPRFLRLHVRDDFLPWVQYAVMPPGGRGNVNHVCRGQPPEAGNCFGVFVLVGMPCCYPRCSSYN